MNDFQHYCIEKRYSPCVTNKFSQLGFTILFVLAVAVVPSIATIKFFLI
jgi:hypothetical protein